MIVAPPIEYPYRNRIHADPDVNEDVITSNVSKGEYAEHPIVYAERHPGSKATANSKALEEGATDVVKWTRNTDLLQLDHPRIRVFAMRLTQLLRTPAERAQACFDHVRRMPFVWSSAPYETTAPAVILSGCGDMHTKSTLFVALLRASGIPARIRALTVSSEHLRGLLPGKMKSVEHILTEVMLPGCGWLSVDAYNMDPSISMPGRFALANERCKSGYGIHLNGAHTWNGRGNALAFLGCAPGGTATTLDLGCFHEVQHFRRTAQSQGRFARGWLSTFMGNLRLRELRSTFSSHQFSAE